MSALTYRISRFFNKYESHNYTKNYYQDNLSNSVDSITYYTELINLQQKKEQILSTQSCGLYEETKKTMAKKYGKPTFRKTNRFHSFTTELLCHKVKLGGHKVIIEVHYFNRVLFYKSYHFRYLAVEEQKKIIENIEKKYSVNNLDVTNEYITDNQKSTISFSNKNSFQIRYIRDINFKPFIKAKEELKEINLKDSRINLTRSQEIYNSL